MSYRPNALVPNVADINVKVVYGARFDGTSHPMSAAALNALYPSLNLSSGNYEQDWAAIQHALNMLLATTGGYVAFQPGDIAVLGGSQIVIGGLHVGIKAASSGTRIFCNAVAGVPVILISNVYGETLSRPIIGSLQLDARMGQGGGQNFIATPLGDNATTAVAHTNFVPGTIALKISQSWNGIIDGIGMHGFDQPFQFGTNAYCWEFRNCNVVGNNRGIGLVTTSEFSNSGERVSWVGGNASNNNVNAYFDWSYGGFDAAIINVSMDYPNVYILQTVDTSGYNSVGSVIISGMSHLETSNKQSGIGPRIVNDGGQITVIGSYLSEQGALHPKGFANFADASGASGSMSFSDNYCFWYNVPLVWQDDTNSHTFYTRGNRARYSNQSVFYAYDSPNGLRMQRDDNPPAVLTSGNANNIMSYEYQGRTIFYDAPSGTNQGAIVIQDDSYSNHEIGTIVRVIVTGQGSVALYPGGNVKLLTVANWTQFSPPNSPGWTFVILKTAASTWVASSTQG